MEWAAYLRRNLLFFVKSGVQVHLLENGFPLDKTLAPHEWFKGGAGWVVKSSGRCADQAVDRYAIKFTIKGKQETIGTILYVHQTCIRTIIV